MDSLAIVTSVLRITTTYVSAAKTLNDIQNAWRLAPDTVSLLCDQLKRTGASLAQIQQLLLGDADVLADKSDVHPAFDTALTSCLVSSIWLKRFMQKVTQGVHIIDGSSWKLEFKQLWNDDDIKEFSEQLQRQQTAMNVVAELLQMQSVLETSQALQKQEDLFQTIEQSTQDFRQTYALDAPDSVLNTPDTNANIFNKLLGEVDPASMSAPRRFETVLLNTKIYSNSMDNVPEDEAEDASDDSASTTIITLRPRAPASDTTGSPAASPIASPTFPSEPTPIRFSKRSLGVRETYAYTQVYHTANTEEELSFNSRRRITNVQKVDDTWYTGQLKGPTGLGLVGRFNRQHVTLKITLSYPITVHAKCSFNAPVIGTQTSVTIDKGQELLVRKLEHDATWTCMEASAPQRRFYVNLELLSIDESIREDVDALLEHFSAAQEDLKSTSQDELEALFRTKLTETWTDAEYTRVAAHCRSFAELQMLGKVYAEVAEGKEEEPE
ncbi:hypothetical protein E8E13_004073 [Curvularia kusanoi]|uniref:SH3 domain-containing protein n=1 Tax=Curvularia kusanoi TaxID=90978 RepID=A0A9P4T7K9_CURKU|nr:hypothetical protein E8E13_004073 [Curvularia kusanoi]